MLKDLVSETGISEEQMHILNAFILHQLATYHANNCDSGFTPKDYLRFWMDQTLNYLV